MWDVSVDEASRAHTGLMMKPRQKHVLFAPTHLHHVLNGSSNHSTYQSHTEAALVVAPSLLG
jgi:hypothetical protein